MNDKNCGNCRFALEVPNEPGRVACRRYPPHILFAPLPKQRMDGKVGIDWSNQAMSFPQLRADIGWCGEHQDAPPRLAINTQ